MRCAMKPDTFNRHGFSPKNSRCSVNPVLFYYFSSHFTPLMASVRLTNMKLFQLALSLLFVVSIQAQIPDAVYSDKIKTAQLYPYGNQLGYPIIKLNTGDRLELHFDDLNAGVRNYSYTYQLCNADWTPAILSHFDYIRGFSQMRISTYRVSSIAFTRYTHYQAVLPDRNCIPTRSGNYILKVFADGDTTKLLFTKRMLVVDEKSTIAAQVQQPYDGMLFKTHQKIQFRVNINEQLNIANPYQQVRVAILQNERWDNAVMNLKPTIFTRNSLDYNTETDAVFPAGKEWRWIDLRSFRLQSERVADAIYTNKSTEIFVRPDNDRSGQRFNFYRDMNGRYTIDVSENINPFWQADYATVHFSFAPLGNNPFSDKEVYLFGKLNNYDLSPSSKMTYNADKGVYEASLFLKQGYYDYGFVTIDRNAKKREASFEAVEGNLWETENDYMILVYYRPLAGRADELIGIGRVNSLTGRR
jgi:hypothetical protein